MACIVLFNLLNVPGNFRKDDPDDVTQTAEARISAGTDSRFGGVPDDGWIAKGNA